jgi:hypothetical protein
MEASSPVEPKHRLCVSCHFITDNIFCSKECHSFWSKWCASRYLLILSLLRRKTLLALFYSQHACDRHQFCPCPMRSYQTSLLDTPLLYVFSHACITYGMFWDLAADPIRWWLAFKKHSNGLMHGWFDAEPVTRRLNCKSTTSDWVEPRGQVHIQQVGNVSGHNNFALFGVTRFTKIDELRGCEKPIRKL